jgi:hypothetical protein
MPDQRAGPGIAPCPWGTPLPELSSYGSGKIIAQLWRMVLRRVQSQLFWVVSPTARGDAALDQNSELRLKHQNITKKNNWKSQSTGQRLDFELKQCLMRENDDSSLTSVQDCDRRARESERGRLGRASERAPRAATNDNEEALDIALGRLFSWATLEVLGTDRAGLLISQPIDAAADVAFQHICSLGVEGIVSKNVRVWTFVGVAQDNQSKCAGTAKVRAGKLAPLQRPSAHVGFSREWYEGLPHYPSFLDLTKKWRVMDTRATQTRKRKRPCTHLTQRYRSFVAVRTSFAWWSYAHKRQPKSSG